MCSGCRQLQQVNLSPGAGLTVSWAAAQSRQQCRPRSWRYVRWSAQAASMLSGVPHQTALLKQHAGGQAYPRRAADRRSLNSSKPASAVCRSRSEAPTTVTATGLGSAAGRGWAAHGSPQTQVSQHPVAVCPAGRRQVTSTRFSCIGPVQFLAETRPDSRPQHGEQLALLL